jgi:hypothetical protein
VVTQLCDLLKVSSYALRYIPRGQNGIVGCWSKLFVEKRWVRCWVFVQLSSGKSGIYLRYGGFCALPRLKEFGGAMFVVSTFGFGCLRVKFKFMLDISSPTSSCFLVPSCEALFKWYLALLRYTLWHYNHW